MFKLTAPVLCTQDALFKLFEFLSYEALTAYKSLLSDVSIRHKLLVGIGHLYVIAENSVIPYFKLRNTCFFLFLGFYLCQNIGRMVHIVHY